MYLGYLLNKNHLSKKLLPVHFANYYSGKNSEITLDDLEKVFPKWIEAWNNSSNKEYDGKYNYVYMGYGNGLCVDKSLYNMLNDFPTSNMSLENCFFLFFIIDLS